MRRTRNCRNLTLRESRRFLLCRPYRVSTLTSLESPRFALRVISVIDHAFTLSSSYHHNYRADKS